MQIQERLRLINTNLNDPNTSAEKILADLNFILTNLNVLRKNFDYKQELFEEFSPGKDPIPWGHSHAAFILIQQILSRGQHKILHSLSCYLFSFYDKHKATTNLSVVVYILKLTFLLRTKLSGIFLSPQEPCDLLQVIIESAVYFSNLSSITDRKRLTFIYSEIEQNLDVLAFKSVKYKRHTEFFDIVKYLIENCSSKKSKAILLRKLFLYNRAWLTLDHELLIAKYDLNGFFDQTVYRILRSAPIWPLCIIQGLHLRSEEDKKYSGAAQEVIRFIVPFLPKKTGKCELANGAFFTVEKIDLRTQEDPFVVHFLSYCLSLPNILPPESLPVEFISDAYGYPCATMVSYFSQVSEIPKLEPEDKEKFERTRDELENYQKTVDPRKSKLRKELANNSEKIREFIEINDFSTTLFSNFDIYYLTPIKDNMAKIVCHDTLLFTEPKAIERAQSYFRLKLQSYNHISSLLISWIKENKKFSSPHEFFEISQRIFKECLTSAIQFEGCNKLLRNDNGPLSEPQIQPFIFSILNTLFNSLLINCDKEPELAGGKVDFLLSYNTMSELFSIAVEFKLAHHKEIDHGLKVQLPAYMNAKRSKYGIFLVFWFKDDNFSQPTKYHDPDELKVHLQTLIPEDKIIEIIIIDCSNQPPPSKR